MPRSQRFHEFRPHPWHGLPAGPDPPRIVTAYIEIGPLDTVKYEIDKVSGYLKVDRPQRGAAQPPTLYGFTGKWEVVKPGTLDAREYDAAVANLVAFMQWMGEPAAKTRVQIGVWVLLFLAVFTVIAWRLNAAYWKDVK